MKVSKTFAVLVVLILAGYFLAPRLIQSYWIGHYETQAQNEIRQQQAADEKHSQTLDTFLSQLPVTDAQLRRCIKDQLSRYPQTLPDAGSITFLSCPAMGIKELSGIQVLVNLHELNLADNGITSVIPLSTIPSLAHVDLTGNKLSSLEPLLAVKTLQRVDMPDVSALFCSQVLEFYHKAHFSLPRYNETNLQCKGSERDIHHINNLATEERLKQGLPVTKEDEIRYLEWKFDRARKNYDQTTAD